VRAYRSLLAGAGARRLALASVLGWLGFGALSLAIVLTVQRAAGSPSAAGAALAGFALGSGVLAPARGRLVDRFGLRRALVPFALGSGAALLGLALAAQEDAPAWLLVALATIAGLSAPPLIASARVVWPQVVAPEQLPAAYGVQALLSDLGAVVGPAFAGAVAALAAPTGALIACATLPAAGALLLVALPWPQHTPRAGRAGALASPGMRTLVLADGGLYLGLGALEVALPAVAAEDGSAAAAALPLAVFAGASAIASLVYGARPAPAGRRYLLGSLAFVVACLPLAALDGLWTLTGALVFAGAAFAAVNVAVFALLDEVVPEGTGAEALTWLTTAGAGGMALGAALAGALAGSGSLAWALALPAAGACLAAVVVLARRATLNGAA
jgi:MFS family permease